MAWKPTLGAVPHANGTKFRVWAPKTETLEVRIVGGATHALRRAADGFFEADVPGVRAGARYLYRFPDGRERPDPATLLQPEGVHAASEVVDLAAITPRRPSPKVPLERLVTCEVHLGTFTPGGTADSAREKLPLLAEAGYTAVEILPVAAFSGQRGWGYDGVQPYATHVAYGGPAALARLVDDTHANGLLAILDVVYNHLGPEGNYLGEFGPYFTSRHKTPWGDALDYSLPQVRQYFIENALRWTMAGGFDGLRLDAVHGIVDDSKVHVLQELSAAVHAAAREAGREVFVIAESDLNDSKLIDAYGMDAAWSDDLHHALHVLLTGEHEGYYEDYAPPQAEPLEALVAALREGWYYGGRHSKHRGRIHGTPAAHLPGRRFVSFLQNHDQIGNRARGDRIVTLAAPGAMKAAQAVVALSPALPLYFQGDEWGAAEPFQYFVDHGDPGLAEAVRKGRRAEFAAFKSFAGEEVPDPMAKETFERSKLDWAVRGTAAGKAALSWHQALLALRRDHPALQDDSRSGVGVTHVPGKRALLIGRRTAGAELLLAVSFEPGEVQVQLPGPGYRVLLDSGEARHDHDQLTLRGPGAVVLERWSGGA